MVFPFPRSLYYVRSKYHFKEITLKKSTRAEPDSTPSLYDPSSSRPLKSVNGRSYRRTARKDMKVAEYATNTVTATKYVRK
jgi:hypothetical protein